MEPRNNYFPGQRAGFQEGVEGITLGAQPLGLSSSQPTELMGTTEEQIGVPEHDEPQIGPDLTVNRTVITRKYDTQPNERLLSYPDTFTELDLIPVRCYSCNKIFKQREIENRLNSGKTIRETMDELNYARLCCRDVILGAPGLVKMQKELKEQTILEDRIGNLTLEATSYRQPGQVTDPIGFIGPASTNQMVIVDDVPPGTVDQTGGICFTESVDSFFDPGTDFVDSYDYFTSQYDN